MPAEMLPANSNVAGGFHSQPHPHTPGGPWTMTEDVSDIGTSNSPEGGGVASAMQINHPDSRVEVVPSYDPRTVVCDACSR